MWLHDLFPFFWSEVQMSGVLVGFSVFRLRWRGEFGKMVGILGGMTDKPTAEEKRVVPEIVAQVLAGRGVAPEDMAGFLWPAYEGGLADPMLLTDMAAAAARIEQAVRRDERVVVYGDYDIDGITASAVMIEGLAALGLGATSYIPDRFEEGYGINRAALEHLKAEGAELVISVDCGITSVEEAGWAREQGLDLIITDHHAVPEVIPEAIAVINPKRPDDRYPFKELAGVGVAYAVVRALQQRTGKPAAGQEKWLLDLVALGTVCDVVPLVGENRTMVSYGLRVLRKTRRQGLRALAAVGGVRLEQLAAYHLGYVLGPRMNAAGRLEHAARSLELVMTAEGDRAREIAFELDELNGQRRADQEAILAAAEVMAAERAADRVLVLADAGWSHGVVGIVASKLVQKLQRPVLVAQVLGEFTKGSARSVPGFNMVEALRANAGLFEKFGGHFFAAGYTLATERLEELRMGLNVYYDSLGGVGGGVTEVPVDVRLEGLARVDWPLLNDLALLEPHGSGNVRPVLAIGGLTVEAVTTMGREGKHMRLRLRDREGKGLTAVGFDMARRYSEVQEGQAVTIVGELNKNDFQGISSIQMILSGIINE